MMVHGFSVGFAGLCVVNFPVLSEAFYPVLIRSTNGRISCPAHVESDETECDADESPFTPTQPQPTVTPDWMTQLGTSPRRIALSTLSATTIALAGNFLGLTSSLLSVLPEESVRVSGLDSYYPRGDFKRYSSSLYTFVFPKEWIGDTALELQKIQRRTRPLDYSMSKPRDKGNVLPDVAFGPPGRAANSQRDVSSADTNVSVIVSQVPPGFSLLGTMGTPSEAASYLLQRMNRNVTLTTAEEVDGNYIIDYVVERPTPRQSLRTVSAIAFAEESDTLVTLTVIAPAEVWVGRKGKSLRKIVSSFQLR